MRAQQMMLNGGAWSTTASAWRQRMRPSLRLKPPLLLHWLLRMAATAARLQLVRLRRLRTVRRLWMLPL
jgi:hypothetical protein